MPNLQCLVADDSDVVRRITRHMLGAIGFTAVEASNGEEALDQCRKAMPDIVVLDWLMPACSGIECLQLLRKLPGGDKPKVIYCTTEHDPIEFARATLAGADDVIVKPYDRQMLRAKLEAVGAL